MSLLSPAQVKTFADKAARIYDAQVALFGTAASHPLGSLYQTALELQDISVDSGDYEIEVDLNSAANTYLQAQDANLAGGVAKSQINGLISALETHIETRGAYADATVVNLPTFLTYYNGGSGSGTVAYENQVPDSFAAMYLIVRTVDLTAAHVYGKSLHPYVTAAYTAGMGSRAVGGAFTAGQAIPTTSSPALALLEVTTTFTTGAAFPIISVAGVDDADGVATTWDVTLDANNPVAAVATTITPAVTAGSRQTVAIGSASGIVAGSVLKVSAGLVDEETVVVETLAGTDITAAFTKAHTAGATLTGFRTYALVSTPASKRIKSVTGITVTISGHAAGEVRVVNRQPRGVV